MAYFSNGTEGMIYEEEYCGNCVHHNGCSVLKAHFLHNYKECNNEESILHILIPKTENGLGNKECNMFYDNNKDDSEEFDISNSEIEEDLKDGDIDSINSMIAEAERLGLKKEVIHAFSRLLISGEKDIRRACYSALYEFDNQEY